MALKSISEGLAFRQIVLETKTAAFDTKADPLDMSGYNGGCFFVSHGTAAAALTIKLVHSDDGTTWEDVLADDVVPSAITANGVTTMASGIMTGKVGYIGIKRYVALDVTGTGLAGTMNVVGVLGAPHAFPTV